MQTAKTLIRLGRCPGWSESSPLGRTGHFVGFVMRRLMSCVTSKIQISIHSVWSESLLCAQWVAKDPKFTSCRQQRLIRLGEYPGWSESLLVTQDIFFWFVMVPLILITVMFLSFWTDKSGQTVQTQIRLLLVEQSDLGLHCLQFPLLLLDALL